MTDSSLYSEWFHWNVSRELFQIPVIDRPVVWYGVFFAVGFVLGYWIFQKMLFRKFLERWPEYCTNKLSKYPTLKSIVQMITDRILWFVVIGMIVGARLGHVLLYDWNWEAFKKDPLDVIRFWDGGLASHGGAIGILIAILLFRYSIRKHYEKFTFLHIIDLIVVPTALVGVFIRIGNFFNQEILGKFSTVAWAIVFEQPFNGEPVLPRHPVQLYEAGAYLIIFVFLLFLWWSRKERGLPGLLTGWFFLLIFTARFIIEFYKEPQSLLTDAGGGINMGQILSIPFILIGLYLILFFKSKERRKGA